MNKDAICTIVSLNYFAQAISLMKSVKRYHKDVDTHILIVDRPQDEEVIKRVETYQGVAKIMYVSDLGIKDFTRMAFRYSVVELNTAVKPFYMDYLLMTDHYDTIMYIDSDILLFHSLNEIYDQLHTAPALFDQVFVLRNPGYNVAFWNLQKRFVSKKEEEYFINETFPLVFYHFSHYHLTRRDRIANVELEERCIPISKRKDIEEIFSIYYDSVMQQEYTYFSKIPYGYNHYDDKSPITKEDRRLFYQREQEGTACEDPFVGKEEALSLVSHK